VTRDPQGLFNPELDSEEMWQPPTSPTIPAPPPFGGDGTELADQYGHEWTLPSPLKVDVAAPESNPTVRLTERCGCAGAPTYSVQSGAVVQNLSPVDLQRRAGAILKPPKARAS
jgi:hypothetical protein